MPQPKRPRPAPTLPNNGFYFATGYSRVDGTITVTSEHGGETLNELFNMFPDAQTDTSRSIITIPVGEPGSPSHNIEPLRKLVVEGRLSLPSTVTAFLRNVTQPPTPQSHTSPHKTSPQPAVAHSSPATNTPATTPPPAEPSQHGLHYTDFSKTKVVLSGHNSGTVGTEMRKYPGVRFTKNVYTIPPAHITEIFAWAQQNSIPIQPELYSDITTLGVSSPSITLPDLARIPLTRLPSVTEKRQEKFSAIGLDTVYDLLFLFPRRYVDRSTSKPVAFLTESEDTGLIAQVSSINYNAGKRMLRIVLTDTTGSITATFFNSAWMAKKFSPGDSVLIYGKPERWKPNSPLSFTNPTIEHYEDTSMPVVPIYPQSSKNSVTTAEIARAMKETIPLIKKILDPLPENTTIRQHYSSRSEAIRQIHFPDSTENAEKARKRLAFDELLRIQIAFAKNKQNRAAEKGYVHTNPTIANTMVQNLPFGLTGAQERTIREIQENLASPHPMHRLLQGDVGAGKAQPLTSKILTPNGYVPLGNINIGDEIANPSGEPSHVTGVFPQGEREVWKIFFTDGTHIECDRNHLWVARIIHLDNNLHPHEKDHATVRTTTHDLQQTAENPHCIIRIPSYAPQNRHNIHKKYRTVTHIVNTRHITPMRCISVSHPNKLYVTDNGTVTHNTTVALYSLLSAVGESHQAALMAPTEILAKQLYRETVTNTEHLSHPDGRPVRTEFFSNQLKGRRRLDTLAELAAGNIDIAVGTHALLTPDIQFHNLSLIVIDEQHRFGVEQRNLLKKKTAQGYAPDTLVMTATPIPRTSAMTVFGDLDISILDELPPGRTPISTVWYDCEPDYGNTPNGNNPWSNVTPRLDAGQQAFIVCPLVEESEKLQAASATETFEQLSAGVLSQYRLGLVHGQQKPAERDSTMERFKNGELDAIVATTVIEVGVNIPNATTIVILDPARFGISQLHQLRGRVGRGTIASQCVMIGRGKTPEARRRLTALCDTTDGFELSEIDLDLRGHGSLFGTSQSGMTDLKIADLREDKKILSYAQNYAHTLLDSNPEGTETNNWVAEAEYFLNPEMLEWLNKS